MNQEIIPGFNTSKPNHYSFNINLCLSETNNICHYQTKIGANIVDMCDPVSYEDSVCMLLSFLNMSNILFFY